MTARDLPDAQQLALRIRRGERAAVAGGLNLLDNALPEVRTRATELLVALSDPDWLDRGHLIGITGPPGAGKSSLLAALIRLWRGQGLRVAVLAVDPSSRPELGGGALLGDRIRMKSATADEGLFIRSLANRNRLGGVASETWPMSWMLLSCFDIVVVETVGVGQTEIDIAQIADSVCYVAQPASGDTIQYLKSGIMEIPDVFAVNKADLGLAATKTAGEIERSGHSRRAAPEMPPGWDFPVCMVSATMNTGIRDLVEHLARHRKWLVTTDTLASRRSRHQSGWGMRLLEDEFGSYGLSRAGGRGAVAARLGGDPQQLLARYAALRQQILSRFATDHPSVSFDTKGIAT